MSICLAPDLSLSHFASTRRHHHLSVTASIGPKYDRCFYSPALSSTRRTSNLRRKSCFHKMRRCLKPQTLGKYTRIFNTGFKNEVFRLQSKMNSFRNIDNDSQQQTQICLTTKSNILCVDRFQRHEIRRDSRFLCRHEHFCKTFKPNKDFRLSKQTRSKTQMKRSDNCNGGLQNEFTKTTRNNGSLKHSIHKNHDWACFSSLKKTLGNHQIETDALSDVNDCHKTVSILGNLPLLSYRCTLPEANKKFPAERDASHKRNRFSRIFKLRQFLSSKLGKTFPEREHTNSAWRKRKLFSRFVGSLRLIPRHNTNTHNERLEIFISDHLSLTRNVKRVLSFVNANMEDIRNKSSKDSLSNEVASFFTFVLLTSRVLKRATGHTLTDVIDKQLNAWSASRQFSIAEENCNNSNNEEEESEKVDISSSEQPPVEPGSKLPDQANAECELRDSPMVLSATGLVFYLGGESDTNQQVAQSHCSPTPINHDDVTPDPVQGPSLCGVGSEEEPWNKPASLSSVMTQAGLTESGINEFFNSDAAIEHELLKTANLEGFSLVGDEEDGSLPQDVDKGEPLVSQNDPLAESFFLSQNVPNPQCPQLSCTPVTSNVQELETIDSISLNHSTPETEGGQQSSSCVDQSSCSENMSSGSEQIVQHCPSIATTEHVNMEQVGNTDEFHSSRCADIPVSNVTENFLEESAQLHVDHNCEAFREVLTSLYQYLDGTAAAEGGSLENELPQSCSDAVTTTNCCSCEHNTSSNQDITTDGHSQPTQLPSLSCMEATSGSMIPAPHTHPYVRLERDPTLDNRATTKRKNNPNETQKGESIAEKRSRASKSIHNMDSGSASTGQSDQLKGGNPGRQRSEGHLRTLGYNLRPNKAAQPLRYHH